MVAEPSTEVGEREGATSVAVTAEPGRVPPAAVKRAAEAAGRVGGALAAAGVTVVAAKAVGGGSAAAATLWAVEEKHWGDTGTM
jgi:hypothetical protein